MQEKVFVITSLQSWDLLIGSNAKDMALEISKKYKVVYVNTPLDFRTARKENPKTDETTYRREFLKGKHSDLRHINDNLCILDLPITLFPVNKLPGKFLFDMFNRQNNKRIFRYVRKRLKELHFENIIHIIDNDIYRSFYAKEFLRPRLSIYYRRDNVLGIKYWSKNGSRLEPLLVKKSNFVAANSIQLADAVRSYNPKAYDIGQGVDLKDFDAAKKRNIPEDIKSIPRPIVGYIGTIVSIRLDAGLMYDIAQQMPHISFVMAGPEDAYFENHSLHQLKNVYFLGAKPTYQVADYINAFDICTNIQLVNEVTVGNYPRKIDEYLALGKPVVTTDTPAMQLFKEYVHLCKNTDDFCKAISTILQQNQSDSLRKERIDFAHTHTWENSVSKLYQLIETYK